MTNRMQRAWELALSQLKGRRSGKLALISQHLIFIVTALLFGPVVNGAETLTLDQAVSIALENNRSLQTSALDIRKAEERLKATRTSQFPAISLYVLGAQQLQSFDFTLEKGVLGNYNDVGPLPSEDVHLKTPLEPTGFALARVSQPLSSLIGIRRNMDTLKTGVELAEEQTRAERQKTVRDIKRLYYNLQQLEASLRSVRETTNLYEEVERLTANYVLQEVALKGDLLDTRTRVAKTQHQETSLQNQQASGKEQLNQLLGRDVLTEFEVQSVADAVGAEISLEEARSKALGNRSEVRQALLRQKQAQQDLRAKKAEYIPEISAEFNSISLLNYGTFLPVQTTSVGASLKWEPFDWGRKRHQSAEKERTVDQASISRREAESLVLLDVNDKYRQLRYRSEELHVARLSQDTAVEHLRVMKNKYAVYSALVKDVLQEQVSLEQTNADYQQALTSFWNARADFEHALGEDQ